MIMSEHNTIKQMVDVNESIKAVAKSANRLELNATNAMLLARKMDNKVGGYAFVTSEFRQFSHQIAGRMKEVKETVSELLYLHLVLKNCTHNQQLISALVEQNGKQKHLIESRYKSRSKVLIKRIDECKNRVSRLIHHSIKLCEVGVNLTLLSKIETAGSSEKSLINASNSIEKTVEEMLEAMTNSRKMLIA